MKAVKQFQRAGLLKQCETINYWLTIYIFEWFDRANGNTYHAIKARVNSELVYSRRYRLQSHHQAYIDTLGALNLPRFDTALHEIGVHVETVSIKSKYREIKTIKSWINPKMGL